MSIWTEAEIERKYSTIKDDEMVRVPSKAGSRGDRAYYLCRVTGQKFQKRELRDAFEAKQRRKQNVEAKIVENEEVVGEVAETEVGGSSTVDNVIKEPEVLVEEKPIEQERIEEETIVSEEIKNEPEVPAPGIKDIVPEVVEEPNEGKKKKSFLGKATEDLDQWWESD